MTGITRAQYNSVRKVTDVSCIDHVYSNAKHRISLVKILTWGSSDHDAVCFIRYSREPKIPARTIRKRSYRNFSVDKYLKDMAALDFTDVYCCLDVDTAADILTSKIVSVLNLHAPWIIFQQHKNYVPWITDDTKKLMQERDRYKEQAKFMARNNCNVTSPAQSDIWCQYKKLRNKVNNLMKQEEIRFKRSKLNECHGSSDQVWKLAKKFINWTSTGAPSQLETEENGLIILVSKAADIARLMNEYFVGKIETIVKGLPDAGPNFEGCQKIMQGKNISMSLQYLTVAKVRRLLASLKNKKSTSVDQMDNFSVKVAADYLARPLHCIM